MASASVEAVGAARGMPETDAWKQKRQNSLATGAFTHDTPLMTLSFIAETAS
jgi:hypothetical protein